MKATDVIKAAYSMPDFICRGYLDDLTDGDLLVRAIPGTNHIAWQLGHLIATERKFLDLLRPGSMPSLPAEFAERHSNDTSRSDNPSDFYTKQEYLGFYDSVRAGTFAVIDSLGDDELGLPGPEPSRSYCPTVESLLLMQPTHWVMHAGQWAIIRRKLGKPPLY